MGADLNVDQSTAAGDLGAFADGPPRRPDGFGVIGYDHAYLLDEFGPVAVEGHDVCELGG